MRLEVDLDADADEINTLKHYLTSMPIHVIINGLNFTYKRWLKEQEGMLRVGRKSKIKQEVSMLTKEQALWRLKNWKVMVKNYREKGYSYPTISRIRKELLKIADIK